MSDETEPSEVVGSPKDQPVAVGRGRSRRGRTIVTIVVAVCLIGGGAGAAVAMTGGSGPGSTGGSSPASAVNRLLNAADHSDLLGAVDALVPGEQAAIESGAMGLVDQLIRLKVLSPGMNLSHVGGVSLRFSGITTRTTMLTSSLAAVAITRGSETGSVAARKLPLGSFVSGLARGLLPTQSQHARTPVSTGHSAIVTEDVGGTWYVSLGYTIAYDAAREQGLSGVPPAASAAVPASGSATPEGAVRALLTDTASLNLAGMIGDLPPGEMGALQSYAPLFLGKAEAALAKDRTELRVKITSMDLSASAVAGGTLVRVIGVGLTARYDGITFSYKEGCLTYTQASETVHRCPSPAAAKAERQAVIARLLPRLPRSLRALVTRLETKKVAIGLMTVQENGRWYVSPTATMFEAMNASLSLLQPQDLVAIASFVENPAEVQSFERSIANLVEGEASSTSSF
jgi:hypothetical protein